MRENFDSRSEEFFESFDRDSKDIIKLKKKALSRVPRIKSILAAVGI